MAIKPRKIFSLLAKILKGILILATLYILILIGIVIWTFEIKLNRWPIFVYSAPFSIKVDDEITKIRLIERLSRLGYVKSSSAVPMPGEWSEAGSGLNLFLKYSPFKGEGIVSGPITLNLDWNRISSIHLLRSVQDINRIGIEPELIGIIPAKGFGPELCRFVPLEAIPPILVDSILLTEDTRFFSHQGIDLSSIIEAVKANIRAGKYVQGGSTISQQLIRMTILSPDKTMGRKINEIMLSLVAEAIYSKQTILQAYLNRVYLGHWGPYPIKGVAEAARHLFGKDLSELTTAECALIAAIIKAPNVINPYKHPERAQGRRNIILGLLLKAGKITREDYEEAINSLPRMLKPGTTPTKAPAFMDLVRDHLPRDLSNSEELRQDIITSLDPLIQHDAELALRRIDDTGGHSHFILADPRSGKLKAFISAGSHKWSGSGGSIELFAPMAIIPALIPEKPDRARYTLTSQIFIPSHIGSVITFRQAFHNERIFLIEKLMTTVGQEKIVAILGEFGIKARSTGPNTLSFQTATPLEVAQSFCTLAAMGEIVPLTPDVHIVGDTSSNSTITKKKVSINPAILFMINHLMKDVGKEQVRNISDNNSLRSSFLTAKDKDGLWCVAYRADIMALLRVRNTNLKISKIKQIMDQLIPPPSEQDGVVGIPDGIVFRNICLDSGLRATSICPHVIREPFLKGTQPIEWCSYRHESSAMRSDLSPSIDR